jgi:glucose-1-phosphatase
MVRVARGLVSDARQTGAGAAQVSDEIVAGVKHKALIFDLGRVLVHFDFRRGYRTLEGLCAYPAAEIPKRISSTDLVQRLEMGLIEPRDFYARFSELLGLDIDYSRFCEIWTSIFTAELLPESLLETLARRYRLVLLSNTNPIHFEMIRGAYPHLKHFHNLVLSYEVGAMKPDEAIYRAALDCAGCRPDECFYTDDIAEYVEGGRRLGIDAVQFESREQLERELRARGIAMA